MLVLKFIIIQHDYFVLITEFVNSNYLAGKNNEQGLTI